MERAHESRLLSYMVATKNKILGLIVQIEDVDKMILFNSGHSSKIMVDQYEYRKEKFLSELIKELMNVRNLSNIASSWFT